MNPTQQQALQALQGMKPEHAQAMLALLAQQANQKTSLWNTYFSTVRLTPVVSGTTGAQTYVITQGQKVQAFSYGINDNLVATAGFPVSGGATQPATDADTNLIKGSQTNAGFQVIIRGIAVQLTADSNPSFAKEIADNVSVSISLNGGTQSWKLGNLAFMPGAGGYYGTARDALQVPDLAQTTAFDPGSIVNGLPSAQNYYQFPQPLIWSPAGAVDSTLVVIFTAERQLSVPTLGPRAATAGVTAYTPPAANVAVGTSPFSDGVGLKVRLISQQIAPRSANQ
jgi:hypothetical protein